MKKFLIITLIIVSALINPLCGAKINDLHFSFPSKNFVIVAHENSINEQLLAQEIQNSTVIALDGASRYLDEKAIPYHILLGDFDSVSPDKVLGTFDETTDDTPPYMHNGHLIIPSKNQNLTDLSKGIEFCDKQGAQKITLFGALGDREDHSELNRNLLKRYYKFGRPLIMRSSCQTLVYISKQDSPYEFIGKVGDKCGFFAYPDTVKITTQGLKWDVQDWSLIFGEQSSACNELTKEKATIIIITGPGLLIIQPNPSYLF